MPDIELKKNNHLVHARAAPVVKVFSELRQVKGIVCFGSYASGTYDEHSDIDLYIFCQPEIVPTSKRQDTLLKIEGILDLHMDHVGFVWGNRWCLCSDRFQLGDTIYEIAYNTVDWIHTIVQRVIKEGKTSIPELTFRPYTMLGLLGTSIVLYDPEGIIREINSTLYPYPIQLKKTIIAQSLRTINGSLEDLHDYVKRSIGNTAFLFHLQRIIDSLGQLIFALNERYDPATKHVEEAYHELAILPDNFLHRYKAILETPLTTGGRKEIVRELQTFVNEIEILAKREAK